MRFAQAAKPAYKLNGFNVFVIFIALFAIAQLLYPVLSILSMPFLLLAFALFAYLLVKGNTNDLFIFLVLTSLTRIVLPSNFREVSLFIPALIAPVIVAKNLYKFKNMKKLYLNSLLFLFFLFVVIISYQIINKMQLPGFLGSQTGNSGFLNRWNLINNLIVFATVFIGFNMEILNYLIQKISWLYAFVLSVSIMMILFGVNKIPLFNTFSWTVIVENQSSKKMIIAGTAAIMLMLYQLAFKKRTTTWLGILFILIIGVALSGSRTAFLSYFLLLIFAYMIYHRVLIRGILLMILSSGIIFALLLSPLVLLVPDKYQRLVVIFPSEFYSGDLAKLRSSAAAKSSNFRYEMWTKAFDKLKDHPLTGEGIGVPKAQYDLGAEGLGAFQKIDSKILIEDFMNSGSLHNTFVSIAYIFGIPAAIVFFIFLVSLLLRTYRLTQIYTGELKATYVFFTLIILNYIIQTFISDIHYSMEFYLFLAIIIKTTLMAPKLALTEEIRSNKA
ncbi:MAG: O-antigen ligase family protein [Bacteroidia bacterium]|nr:O-antigen ligase family protein [Bacteroidia bacterium]